MVKVMPVSLSLAITMGVAPLLFVQVLYGRFLYCQHHDGRLVASYSATGDCRFLHDLYPDRQTQRRESSNVWTRFGSVLNALIFLAVAFLFTNNAVLVENQSTGLPSMPRKVHLLPPI